MEKKSKAGRPKLTFTDDQVEILKKMAQRHSSDREMAHFLGCSVDTLELNFSELIHKEKSKGKMSLRDAQFKAAMGGNIAMLIWLGKVILGQTEKIEHKVENTSADTETLKHLAAEVLKIARKNMAPIC